MIISVYGILQPHQVQGLYGFGKTNVRKGLLPPLSGAFNNAFGGSMGCPIRSEIWACIAPGLPLLALEHGAVLVEINPFETPLSLHADQCIRGPASGALSAIAGQLKSRLDA